MYKCMLKQTNSHHHTRTPSDIWAPSYELKGKTGLQGHWNWAWLFQRNIQNNQGNRFPHQTHPSLPSAYNSFMQVANINKQQEVQNRQQKAQSANLQGTWTEPPKTRENSSTGTKSCFPLGMKADKVVKKKVNEETLWSRRPSCVASSVNINRILIFSVLWFIQINSAWVSPKIIYGHLANGITIG